MTFIQAGGEGEWGSFSLISKYHTKDTPPPPRYKVFIGLSIYVHKHVWVYYHLYEVIFNFFAQESDYVISKCYVLQNL